MPRIYHAVQKLKASRLTPHSGRCSSPSGAPSDRVSCVLQADERMASNALIAAGSIKYHNPAYSIYVYLNRRDWLPLTNVFLRDREEAIQQCTPSGDWIHKLGRYSAFFTKQMTWMHSLRETCHDDVTMYVDADTITTGPLNEIAGLVPKGTFGAMPIAGSFDQCLKENVPKAVQERLHHYGKASQTQLSGWTYLNNGFIVARSWHAAPCIFRRVIEFAATEPEVATSWTGDELLTNWFCCSADAIPYHFCAGKDVGIHDWCESSVPFRHYMGSPVIDRRPSRLAEVHRATVHNALNVLGITLSDLQTMPSWL